MPTPKTPRVFQIEPTPRFNTSGAAKYGELFVLFEEFNPFNAKPRDIMVRLVNANFDSQVDYVCLTGSVISVAMFLAVVTNNFDAPYKLLIFHAKTSQYQERLFQPYVDEPADEQTEPFDQVESSQ